MTTEPRYTDEQKDDAINHAIWLLIHKENSEGEYDAGILESLLAERKAAREAHRVSRIDIDADQARELFAFIAAEDDFSPFSLLIGNGHSGYGLYASMTEYPDEGATFITPMFCLSQEFVARTTEEGSEDSPDYIGPPATLESVSEAHAGRLARHTDDGQLFVHLDDKHLEGLADQIAASCTPDDPKLEVAYAIARYLKLDWPSAHAGREVTDVDEAWSEYRKRKPHNHANNFIPFDAGYRAALKHFAHSLPDADMARPAVLAEVLTELKAATAKFSTWPTDPLHALGVLHEEIGELAKAVLQQVYEPHKNEPGDVRKEAVQAAAMAIRFLISVDVYEFKLGQQHQQKD